MSKLITLTGVSLSFDKKVFFSGFSTQVYAGSRIAVIGRNGSGKSTLLKMIHQSFTPSSGEISLMEGLCVGYVEQTIDEYGDLSGGQRFNKRLSQALSESPDVLLLDEPTNHLDSANRRGLIRMLQKYDGVLIVVSHDTQLLRECTDTLWHINEGEIVVFSGAYDDYRAKMRDARIQVEREMSLLKREKKASHQSLMKEQVRAKKK